MRESKRRRTDTSKSNNNNSSSGGGSSQGRVVGSKWTEHEQLLMLEALRKFGTGDLPSVAQHIPGRSFEQVRCYLRHLRFSHDNSPDPSLAAIDRWQDIVTRLDEKNWSRQWSRTVASSAALRLAALEERQQAAEQKRQDFSQVYLYLATLASNEVPALPESGVAECLLQLLHHLASVLSRLNCYDHHSWLFVREQQLASGQTDPPPVTHTEPVSQSADSSSRADQSAGELVRQLTECALSNPLHVPASLLTSPVASVFRGAVTAPTGSNQYYDTVGQVESGLAGREEDDLLRESCDRPAPSGGARDAGAASSQSGGSGESASVTNGAQTTVDQQQQEVAGPQNSSSSSSIMRYSYFVESLENTKQKSHTPLDIGDSDCRDTLAELGSNDSATCSSPSFSTSQHIYGGDMMESDFSDVTGHFPDFRQSSNKAEPISDCGLLSGSSVSAPQCGTMSGSRAVSPSIPAVDQPEVRPSVSHELATDKAAIGNVRKAKKAGVKTGQCAKSGRVSKRRRG